MLSLSEKQESAMQLEERISDTEIVALKDVL
jgi:hypothetical protein